MRALLSSRETIIFISCFQGVHAYCQFGTGQIHLQTPHFAAQPMVAGQVVVAGQQIVQPMVVGQHMVGGHAMVAGQQMVAA